MHRESDLALVRCKKCWQQVSAETTTCPRCGARISRRVSTLALIVGVILVIAGSVTYHRYQGTDWFSPLPRKPNPVAEARAEAIRYIDFKYSWNKSGIGTPMRMDVTLTNRGEFDVMSIMIVCEHRSPAGAVLDANSGIYWGTVKALETIKINNLDLGLIRVDAPAVDCRVKDLAVLEKPAKDARPPASQP